MKNILYGFLATLLFCSFSFAQLMSDASHKTMMDAYATNLTNELTANLPQGQGLSIDQYKRGILKGSYTLSPTAKSNITSYATQLKTYGAAFATAKGLVANTDALKYFYSTFMPSTVVLGGTIVESTTAPGLRGLEMWNCALKSFNAENCGSTLLIGDENNLGELADISVNILKLPTEDPTNPENMGILVMLNGFGECMQKYFQLEQVAFNVSRHANFANLVNRIDWFSNQTVNQVRIDELIAAERALTTSEVSELAVSLGFLNTQALNDFGCNTETDINIIKGSITSVSNEDEIIVINSASKYYPDQTKITGFNVTEEKMGNFGITLSVGNCSGVINPPLDTNGIGADIVHCLGETFGLTDIINAVGTLLAGTYGEIASVSALISALDSYALAIGYRAAIRAGAKLVGNILLKSLVPIGLYYYSFNFTSCMLGF